MPDRRLARWADGPILASMANVDGKATANTVLTPLKPGTPPTRARVLRRAPCAGGAAQTSGAVVHPLRALGHCRSRSRSLPGGRPARRGSSRTLRAAVSATSASQSPSGWPLALAACRQRGAPERPAILAAAAGLVTVTSAQTVTTSTTSIDQALASLCFLVRCVVDRDRRSPHSPTATSALTKSSPDGSLSTRPRHRFDDREDGRPSPLT
jgi:hypothetical protein